jgi:capsular polysaccharide biosynthesis protein
MVVNRLFSMKHLSQTESWVSPSFPHLTQNDISVPYHLGVWHAPDVDNAAFFNEVVRCRNAAYVLAHQIRHGASAQPVHQQLLVGVLALVEAGRDGQFQLALAERLPQEMIFTKFN